MFLRALLIWLMVLAVPAQGAAAVTMAFCGPAHHAGQATPRAQPRQAVEHAQHESHARQAHDHSDVASTPMADDETGASTDAVKVASSGHIDKQKCSACASCCSMAAVPNSVLSVPPPVVAPVVFSTVVPDVDAFAADGPDRPPRIVLA